MIVATLAFGQLNGRLQAAKFVSSSIQFDLRTVAPIGATGIQRSPIKGVLTVSFIGDFVHAWLNDSKDGSR